MIELRINNNNFPWHSYACGKKTTQGPGKFSTILSFTNGDSMVLNSKDNIELNNWSNCEVVDITRSATKLIGTPLIKKPPQLIGNNEPVLVTSSK
jgi:hypothetical protein